MSEQIKTLQQILIMTQQMLDLAQQEQWPQLAELQSKRTPLLEKAFPLQASEASDEVRPILEKVIEVNQQVEELCRTARQQIQTELSSFNKNKKAAAAYRSN